MIGRTLAHYEIVDELGRGGMGEVYRARDTKLKRDVAIKVLPEEFAQDKERLARFEREAQLLASLNHPNIASIYGIEDADGVKALVLELVEGPTLAERIAAGRIPVDEAIAIAKQIAAALEAAHGNGVIHRDLKPANVKPNEDGQVKVLDFGLAKALQGEAREATGSELSQSPTLTRQGTAVGVILGTAAYMSPEQAKGKRVDRQTDIWAFGAVLYEMLTGRRAFAGNDVSDILAAVLRAEPDWSALPSDTPETIRQVLRLCLAKERKNRLQAIGDVRLAMDGAYEVSSPGGRRSPIWLAVAAAFVLGSVMTGLLVSNAGPNGQTRPVVRFGVPLPESRGWTQVEMAISPNDANLALRMGDDLYLRPLGSLDALRVPHNGPAVSPLFSADGEWLFFFAQGQLKKVAVGPDMTPVVVCAVPGAVSGASLSGDDAIVFAQSPGGIYRVAGNGGNPELVIALDETEYGQFPQALPGGEAILFTLRPSSSTPWEEAQIVVQSLATGERKVVVDGGRAGLYTSTGHVIYNHGGTLFAVAFDPTSWDMGSASVPLLEVAQPAWPYSRERNFDLSPNGSLVYGVRDASLDTTPVWVARDGQERELGLPPKPYQWLHISPDGSRVVLSVREGTVNADIWIHDFARNLTSPFTFDAADDLFPIWTPDGERIIFWSERDGGCLFWKRSNGTGAAERLTPETYGRSMAYSVSPDGRRLLFNTGAQASEFDIFTVTLDDEHIVEPLLDSPYDERRASISPNGRWIAYVSDETGEYNVFVRPYPDVNGGQWRVSSNGGLSPRWSRNGAALYYWQVQTLMRVEFESDPTFTFSAPEKFLEGPYRTGSRGSDDIADGERTLLIKEDAGGIPDVYVVLNWIDELKARVSIRN